MYNSQPPRRWANNHSLGESQTSCQRNQRHEKGCGGQCRNFKFGTKIDRISRSKKPIFFFEKTNSASQSLMKPGRVFIFEGLLMRLAKDKGRYKNVYVYLFLLSDQILETTQQRRNFLFKSAVPMVDVKGVVADTAQDGAFGLCERVLC